MSVFDALLALREPLAMVDFAALLVLSETLAMVVFNVFRFFSTLPGSTCLPHETYVIF